MIASIATRVLVVDDDPPLESDATRHARLVDDLLTLERAGEVTPREDVVRLWRGARDTKRSGSGLGLAIVAATVERHGGRVRVSGSTFMIDIPGATRLAKPQLGAPFPRSRA